MRRLAYTAYWLMMVGLAITLLALAVHGESLLMDLRFGQRTVLVADEKKRTLTLVPGPNVWVCAPHDGGRSCRDSHVVAAWLLSNGEDR